MRHSIVWFTGLPCSGKTSLAALLAEKTGAEVLDGDDLRKLLNNTDFSREGRKKHMLATAELAFRFSKYVPVAVALVSPIKSTRDYILQKYENLYQVFVSCPLEVCESRDVKGMYKKARAGEIKDFTGVSSDYESPIPTDIKTLFVRTDLWTPKRCVEEICGFCFR